MKKINYIISSFLIIALFIITSCRDKHPIKPLRFNKEIIDSISKETTDLPSAFSSIFFFGKCSSGNIALLEIQDLRGLHKIKFPNLDFHTFLEKSLNQEINVDLKDKIKCFELDEDITSMYTQNDFKTFLDLTCEKVNDGSYTLKKNINEKQINTVLYYCFINNYLAVFDDYIGKYYINTDSKYLK